MGVWQEKQGVNTLEDRKHSLLFLLQRKTRYVLV